MRCRSLILQHATAISPRFSKNRILAASSRSWPEAWNAYAVNRPGCATSAKVVAQPSAISLAATEKSLLPCVVGSVITRQPSTLDHKAQGWTTHNRKSHAKPSPDMVEIVPDRSNCHLLTGRPFPSENTPACSFPRSTQLRHRDAATDKSPLVDHIMATITINPSVCRRPSQGMPTAQSERNAYQC
jgi:hypothetical protein